MSLTRLPDPLAARDWCAAVRTAGGTLGFVPTMGALHEGHLSLVRRSVEENDRTCVSVFVNPLQFDDAEDLAAYPRDLEGDAALLAGVGCALLFTGTLAGFFPGADSREAIPAVDPGPAAGGLEGEHRAGHFRGVATIVRRLFELTRPTRAYFGEKDFQQTLVVRHVAAGLSGGPEIVVVPTSREPGGLARSSRNLRLDVAGRERARCLSRALRAARAAWGTGMRAGGELARTLGEELVDEPIDLEYAEVRDPGAWSVETPVGDLVRARAFVAARIDGVRLIDTLALSEEPEA